MRPLPIAAGVATLLASTAAAQDHPTSLPSTDAIAAWLRSEADDLELLASAVAEVLEGGEPAARAAADAIRAIGPASTGRTAAELLLRDVALGRIEAVRESEMRYAGQFAALAPLQPWIGRIYTQLLLDTPDWFPDDMRGAVVPALRDLYLKGPDIVVSDRIHALATDTEFQPAALRHALACALAQWGDRTLIEPLIAELIEGAGARQSGDELYFVRSLASLHYELREYDAAADHWVAFLRGTEKNRGTPRPVEYYNAGCSLALASRVDAALDELERCAALLRSEDLDESLRLERTLFERDPELALVRPTPRFERLIEAAFDSEHR